MAIRGERRGNGVNRRRHDLRARRSAGRPPIGAGYRCHCPCHCGSRRRSSLLPYRRCRHAATADRLGHCCSQPARRAEGVRPKGSPRSEKIGWRWGLRSGGGGGCIYNAALSGRAHTRGENLTGARKGWRQTGGKQLPGAPPDTSALADRAHFTAALFAVENRLSLAALV